MRAAVAAATDCRSQKNAGKWEQKETITELASSAGNVEQMRDICICSAITIRDRKESQYRSDCRQSVVARTDDAMAPIIQDYRFYSVTMPEIDKTRENCIIPIQRDEVRSTRGKRKEEKVRT
ncbi:hypothetical protein HN011_000930 [Eciton burchellii]|nr:hypothetical protein HN011_000930 [Eciton burchellii]